MTSPDDKTAERPVDPGAGIVFGRFVTESIIGRGGMGVVYRAKDPVIGRTVAIKALRTDTDLTDDRREELQSRFELEFQSAGTLSHPNVVTIYDVGQKEGVAFIAMEFVDGKTVDQLLRSGETLTYEQISDLARDLCAGLDYAHQAGVVHRDVKPANVILTPHGQAKIMDFGVAKVRSADLTQTGSVIGTPSYMAPEQIMGREVTGACDQFAAAAIFYHMLTGRLPFAADDPATILYKVAHEAAQPPTEISPSLPQEVDQVIGRALSKNAEDRFESCSAFAKALRGALLGHGTVMMSSVDASPAATERLVDTALSDVGGTTSAPGGSSTDAAARGVTLSHGPDPAGSTYESAGSWWHRTSAGPRFALVGIVLIAVVGAAWFGLANYGPPGVRDTLNGLTEGIFGNPDEPLTPVADRETTETPVPTVERPEAPTVSTFQVASTPSGATLTVDGEVLDGTTPRSIELVLGKQHEVTASKDGFQSETLELQPDAGTPTELSFDLQRVIQPGRITTRADYPVEIYLHGRRLPGGSIRPGTHDVQLVSRQVYLDVTRQFDVRAGETVSVDLPSAVDVRLVSIGPNAVVSIDGRPAVEGLPTDIEIVAGTHTFAFTWPDGSSRSSSLRVTSSTTRVIGTVDEISASDG